VIYPNSGEAWDAARETWVAGTGVTEAEAMAQRLLEAVQHIETVWRRRNNDSLDESPPPPLPSILVGGCCRTTPATIAALSRRIDAHLAQK